jgi:hypothetical protein
MIFLLLFAVAGGEFSAIAESPSGMPGSVNG